jgi:hypothetical protein
VTADVTFPARAFVAEHGIVLASAHHAVVPSLAAAVAGERIRGSWWAHRRSHDIFRALATLEDTDNCVFTRLVAGKVTIVHRRLWPALVALAPSIGEARLARVVQEHTASGKHVTHETPFPAWLPADLPVVDESAARLALGKPLVSVLLRRAPAR